MILIFIFSNSLSKRRGFLARNGMGNLKGGFRHDNDDANIILQGHWYLSQKAWKTLKRFWIKPHTPFLMPKFGEQVRQSKGDSLATTRFTSTSVVSHSFGVSVTGKKICVLWNCFTSHQTLDFAVQKRTSRGGNPEWSCGSGAHGTLCTADIFVRWQRRSSWSIWQVRLLQMLKLEIWPQRPRYFAAAIAMHYAWGGGDIYWRGGRKAKVVLLVKPLELQCCFAFFKVTKEKLIFDSPLLLDFSWWLLQPFKILILYPHQNVWRLSPRSSAQIDDILERSCFLYFLFFRNVVKSFYTSSMLMDVLSTFGEVSEDVSTSSLHKISISRNDTIYQENKILKMPACFIVNHTKWKLWEKAFLQGWAGERNGPVGLVTPHCNCRLSLCVVVLLHGGWTCLVGVF